MQELLLYTNSLASGTCLVRVLYVIKIDFQSLSFLAIFHTIFLAEELENLVRILYLRTLFRLFRFLALRGEKQGYKIKK